jgi:hypothetical protein
MNKIILLQPSRSPLPNSVDLSAHYSDTRRNSDKKPDYVDALFFARRCVAERMNSTL